MTENRENLEELLSSFFDERKTHEAAEDIRLGEEILDGFGAPEPEQAVIDGIKTQIGVHLRARKRQRSIRLMVRRVAVAAVIIACAMAGLRLFTGPERKVNGLAKAGQVFIWEESGAGGDEQLAALTAEVNKVEADMLAIRLDESGDENGSVVTDLEAEMVDINGDFWKG
jgi:hypothetical protein